MTRSTMTNEDREATTMVSDFEADLTVEHRSVVAEGVVSLTLRHADHRPLPPWSPGAHVDLVLDRGLTRQYSLCGELSDPYRWQVAVLREPQSRGGSLQVHDQLRAGAQVRVRGPRNRFPLRRASGYLFIAGGIGITAILPMIAAAQASGTPWRLVYGGRRRASMAFLDRLDRFGDRVTVCPQDKVGLLDLDALLSETAPDTLVYSCGPEPLLYAVDQRFTRWPADALHVERFTPKPVPRTAVDGEFEVVLRRSGRTLAVGADASILRVLEDARVDILSSCREGTCGTCETGVLEGRPEHRDSVLTAAERAADDVMMICVSRSHSARLVLDL
jgi:ferredoxin-NADP reductase